MIEHSPTAWQHELFCNIVQKVANQDIYYKAIMFYLSEQPMMLNELLKHLTNKLDLTKAISVVSLTKNKKNEYSIVIKKNCLKV